MKLLLPALVAWVAIVGSEGVTFTAVTCENKAFAPIRRGKGQFTTGACPSGKDSDCAENCCEINTAICRAPLSLTPGLQFCRNGYTPQFNGQPCRSAEEAIGKRVDAGAPPAVPPEAPPSFTVPNCRNTEFAPQSGGGRKGVNAKCDKDDDCITGCCDLVNRCRVSFSLIPGREFCRGSGFTPIFSGPRCSSRDEAFGKAANTPPAPAPAPAPAATPKPTLRGDRKLVGFQVPACRNVDFVPKGGKGTQFITGSCNSNDDECASGCCDFNGKCRAALAMKTGVEFCQSGFTPQFTGAPCVNQAQAIGNPIFQGDENAGGGNNGNVGDKPIDVINKPPVLPIAFTTPNCLNQAFKPASNGRGQFTTGNCKEDSECFENCCDLKGKCRNALALQTGKEFCRGGFTPVFDAPPERRTCANAAEAIGQPIFADNNNGGNKPTPAPTKQPFTEPPPLPITSSPTQPRPTNIVGFSAPNCRNAGFAPQSKGSGQGITGPCTKDVDCASNCCDLKGKCRAPLAMKTGEEFCEGSLFTPVFDAPPERRTCSNAEEAKAKPIFANDPNAPPKPTPSPTQAPVQAVGEGPIRFQTPKCRNVAFQPKSNGGGQFVTGACSKDADCATNCCDLKNKCRNPLALATGLEFCKNGFTAQFNGPECKNEQEAIGQSVFLQSRSEIIEYSAPSCNNGPWANMPQLGDAQFSESCATDSDCQTGCCEINSKICVSALGLVTGKEFCTNGWTPVLTGDLCRSGAEAVGEVVSKNSGAPGTIILAVVGVIVAGGVGALAYQKYASQTEVDISPSPADKSTAISNPQYGNGNRY